MGPASIVVRREAPGRCVYPGPAPRADVRPVAIAVGRPVGGHVRGIPDLAVVRVGLPGAVLVQILRTDHVRRHILLRRRGGVALVAAVAPGVEVVAALDVVDRHVIEGRIGELVGAARGHHALRSAFTIDGGAAVEVGHAGGLAVLADVHAVGAGLVDHQRHGRRVDLVALAVLHVAHGQVHRALGEFDLGELVVERQETEVGVVRDAQRAAVQLQFGAAAVAGGQAVARGQRPVQAGVAPVLITGRQQAHIALTVGKPRDARGRVAARIAVVGRRLRLRQRKTAGAGQQGHRHPSPAALRCQESRKHTHRVLRSWTRRSSRGVLPGIRKNTQGKRMPADTLCGRELRPSQGPMALPTHAVQPPAMSGSRRISPGALARAERGCSQVPRRRVTIAGRCGCSSMVEL